MAYSVKYKLQQNPHPPPPRPVKAVGDGRSYSESSEDMESWNGGLPSLLSLLLRLFNFTLDDV